VQRKTQHEKAAQRAAIFTTSFSEIRVSSV